VAAENLGVLQVGEQDRPPLADRAGGRAGRIRRGREGTNAVEDRLVGGVLGHRRDSAEVPVGLDQVDDAEVGEIRDGH
jgi:hypothetical protein